MQCQRCQGVMVIDYFVDLEASNEVWMPGWRCLSCGEVIDPLIANHRQRQKAQPDLLGTEQVSSKRESAPPIPVRPVKRSVCRS